MKISSILVACLFMCLSTTTLAKGGDKDQVLVTPPLAVDKFYQVTYLNKSGRELDLHLEWFDFKGDSLWKTPDPISVVDGGVSWIAFDVGNSTSYAHVYWFGKSDDVMITVCSLDDIPPSTLKSCVRAN